MNSSSQQTLNDVCEFIVDCLHKTAPLSDEGYPSIRTPNVGKGRLILKGVNRVSDATYQEWTKRAKPQANDLILAREAPAGNVAIVKEGQVVCLGQRTVHLRPDHSKIDPDFLCYFLLAPRQRGMLLAGETGATAGHVNMKDIRRLPLIDLPSIHSQRKIGKILAAYDDLIENNRRRIGLLEQAARLLYREWFVHLRFPGHETAKIVDGLPEGWEKTTLGKHCPLIYGKALKAETRIDGPFDVYGSSGIVGTHNKALTTGPAIIVGRKGNVGSVYWARRGFWPIDTVYFIDPSNSDFFTYFALQNIAFQNTDVAVPGLNRDYAHTREIKLPPNEMVRSFNDRATVFLRQAELLSSQNDALIRARDLLLPRLMDGRIPV